MSFSSSLKAMALLPEAEKNIKEVAGVIQLVAVGDSTTARKRPSGERTKGGLPRTEYPTISVVAGRESFNSVSHE